eukprot:TRINITY_DN21584_c0_g1_i1.p1 TRINITY_DN21584_c0_g1~~TRINITY_DN21584_c0_g1_i1.p1  ORF type:complete len:801 (+),score=154.51 TRINITY_DN21584_c0_g1_i1:86-2488(+)
MSLSVSDFFTWGKKKEERNSSPSPVKSENDLRSYQFVPDIVFQEELKTGFSSLAGHLLLLTDSGSAYGFGRNDSGQLGLSNNHHQHSPQMIPHNTDICAVACGGTHTLLLTLSGKLLSFGGNDSGQLGLGHRSSINSPQHITKFLPDLTSPIVSMVSGLKHNLILTENGDVYGFGCNEYGRLGLGSIPKVLLPQLIPEVSGRGAVVLACGFNHSLVVTRNEEVYVFGRSDCGQLGIGKTTNLDYILPVKNDNLTGSGVISVACGSKHTLALTYSGDVLACGSNEYGQLGLGDNISRNTPVKVKFFIKKNVASIACGCDHSLVLDNNGNVFVFGYNAYGQLGLGNRVHQNFPQHIPQSAFENKGSISIACGSDHSLILTEKRDVFVFGYNVYGRLGLGNNNDQLSPQKIDFFTGKGAIPITSQKTMKKNFEDIEGNSTEIRKFLLGVINVPEYSDFKVTVMNEVFYLHKAILALRCPKIFEFEVLEIEITIWNIFLEFIYANIFRPGLDYKDLVKLFQVAHILEQIELGNLCLYNLVIAFNASTVLEVFSLAHNLNLQIIIDACRWYISKTGLSTEKLKRENVDCIELLQAPPESTNSFSPKFIIQMKPLVVYLETLYWKDIFSDFTLRLNHSHEIHLHQFVLSKWPFFTKFLKKNPEHYSEVPVKTFKKFLKYLYTGQLLELDLTDCGWLLAFAEYYCIDQNLIDYCNSYLNGNLNQKNWLEGLKLSLGINNKELRAKSISFAPPDINKNLMDFFLTTIDDLKYTITKYQSKIASQDLLISQYDYRISKLENLLLNNNKQ